jgi:hypothetical protein
MVQTTSTAAVNDWANPMHCSTGRTVLAKSRQNPTTQKAQDMALAKQVLLPGLPRVWCASPLLLLKVP